MSRTCLKCFWGQYSEELVPHEQAEQLQLMGRMSHKRRPPNSKILEEPGGLQSVLVRMEETCKTSWWRYVGRYKCTWAFNFADYIQWFRESNCEMARSCHGPAISVERNLLSKFQVWTTPSNRCTSVRGLERSCVFIPIYLSLLCHSCVWALPGHSSAFPLGALIRTLHPVPPLEKGVQPECGYENGWFSG